LKRFFETLLDGPVEPEDGLVWGKVAVAPIREDQQYQGVRMLTHATLAGAVVEEQIAQMEADLLLRRNAAQQKQTPPEHP
jgi:hypothetical protein